MDIIKRIPDIQIGNKTIGENSPAFIIAEMSGNHNMDYSRAEEIVYAAKEAGADAIKLQTYTADTITLDSDRACFQTGDGLWKGQTLYELYQKAYTPWEWQPKLKDLADKIGLILFSSPFDPTSVDFLEEMDVPAYKIASFEITDIPLIKKIALLGKPIIFSTGVASMGDIDLALSTCREAGNDQTILLKCTSQYPAPYENMNLSAVKTLQRCFQCNCGLSDHTLGDEVAVAGVALGAKVIEKHFTLKRADGGVDSAFSMEKEEFAAMVQKIRNVEKAIGTGDLRFTSQMECDRGGARSLFVCKEIKAGKAFTEENIRSVRPGIGMPPRYLEEILGKKATRDLEYAKPLEKGDVAW